MEATPVVHDVRGGLAAAAAEEGVEEKEGSEENQPMGAAQKAFVAIGLLGIVLPYSCIVRDPLFSDMILKPWVLRDPWRIPHLFGVFIKSQGINSTTTAVFGSFLLLLGILVIINCRATPSSMTKRVFFHFFGVLVSVASAFPLQCAFCRQPSTPVEDGILTWVSTFAWSVGLVCVFYQSNDIIVFAWYIGMTAVGIFLYDHFAGKASGSSATAFRMLAVVNAIVCFALWSLALWHRDGTPFALWFTAGIFWDFMTCTVCGAGWVVMHTESYMIGALTLICPSAGIALAMANIADRTASFEDSSWKRLPSMDSMGATETMKSMDSMDSMDGA